MIMETDKETSMSVTVGHKDVFKVTCQMQWTGMKYKDQFIPVAPNTSWQYMQLHA